MGQGTRASLLLCLVLATALATPGCLSFRTAHVPDKFLEGPGGNGWERVENKSMAEPESEWMGFKKTQVLTYQDRAAGGPGYPGTLTLVTLRAPTTYSPDTLKDLIKDQVRTRAEASGLKIQGDPIEGTRTLSNGAESQYFVYTANVTQTGFFTAKDAGAKIVGEVWNCADAKTSVIAVGFAQVNARSTTAGITLPGAAPGGSRGADPATWREIVADKDGSIDGHKGERGLIWNIAC